MKLNSLSNYPQSKKKRKRVGRGISSGTGKTCGRGHKGQKSRSGVSIKTEGGQTPFIKRVPKKGFISHINRYTAISTDQLITLIKDSKLDIKDKIDIDVLKKLRILHKGVYQFKIIKGKKEFPYKAHFATNYYSKAVKDLVLKAGGSFL
ncbi:MAG: 50S ribosomal protein L15 [Rickettsia sp.]|nr:50S ribosomal protein L15 [Rickettsia sp.]